ncbi:hypothetical protein pb186bvf_017179 [Paramecium bursaria]
MYQYIEFLLFISCTDVIVIIKYGNSICSFNQFKLQILSMSLICDKISIEIDTNQQTTYSDLSQSINDCVSSKISMQGRLQRTFKQNGNAKEGHSLIKVLDLRRGSSVGQLCTSGEFILDSDRQVNTRQKCIPVFLKVQEDKAQGHGIQFIDLESSQMDKLGRQQIGKVSRHLWKNLEKNNKMYIQNNKLLVFPGMSSRIVRGRYLNHLQKGLINQKWSESEDLELIKLYHTYGNKWSQIAKELGGRSENNVKNRFHSYLKKKVFGLINPYQVVSGVL